MRFPADYSEALEVFFFFLMPTDGISAHLYVSQSVDCEMATVLCVGWLLRQNQSPRLKGNYRTQFNKQPPSDYAIRDWQRRFLGTGSVHDRKRSGRPGVSDECVETIRAWFVRSPTKSTRRASRELLLLPRSIFQNPEWTLWTHCTILFAVQQISFLNAYRPNSGKNNFKEVKHTSTSLYTIYLYKFASK
jgi:hypothetical protein